MRNTKALTFNLCNFDDFHLAFVNRKGVTLYSISFIRAFASSRHRTKGEENAQTRQSLRFTHYNRENRIQALHVEHEFRAMDAPRVSDAGTLEQTIKLNGPIEVTIEGADGAALGFFCYRRASDDVQFNVNHEDGSGYGFFHFPPEAEFKPRRERKVAK